MYYIRHDSDNFTIIDCMLPTDDMARCEVIVDELIEQSRDKGITRFISTHPDQDHVQGLKYLDSRMGLLNFYCVKNAASKQDPTEDFDHYCTLRDDPKKVAPKSSTIKATITGCVARKAMPSRRACNDTPLRPLVT